MENVNKTPPISGPPTGTPAVTTPKSTGGIEEAVTIIRQEAQHLAPTQPPLPVIVHLPSAETDVRMMVLFRQACLGLQTPDDHETSAALKELFAFAGIQDYNMQDEHVWILLLQTLIKNEQVLKNINQLTPHEAKKICLQIVQCGLPLDPLIELGCHAVEHHCLELFILLLDSDLNLNSPNAKGNFLITLAAQQGDEDIVKALIGALDPHGCFLVDLDVQNWNGTTTLEAATHYAIVSKNPNILWMLIHAFDKQGRPRIDIHARGLDGETIYTRAIKEGNKEIIKTLLDARDLSDRPLFNLDAHDKDGYTLLSLAAIHGQREIVDLLLIAGSEVDLPNYFGSTTLMLAAAQGQEEIVNTLLRAGAAVDAHDRYDHTPLMYATREGRVNVVRTLMRHQADVNVHNQAGDTALMLATQKGYLEIVQELLEEEGRTNVDIQNKNGETALILAAMYLFKGMQQHAIAQALIQAKANVHIRDGQNCTALMQAILQPTQNLEGEEQLLSQQIIHTLMKAGSRLEKNDFALLYQKCDNSLVADSCEQAILHQQVQYSIDVLPNSTSITPTNLNKQQQLESLREMTQNPTIIDNFRRLTDEQAKEVFSQLKTLVDFFKLSLNKELPEMTFYAANNNCIALLKFLLYSGADVNTFYKIGERLETLLLHAIRNEQLDVVRILIDAGAYKRATGLDEDSPYTPLILVLKNDLGKKCNQDILHALIDAEYALEFRDNAGRTALMWAVQLNSVEGTQALLAAHADIHAKDDTGKTALMIAAELGRINEEIARRLLQSSADINAHDNNGKTALMLALENQNWALAHMLVSAHADLNLTDRTGRSALMIAISERNEEIARALIAAGADMSVRTPEGQTAIMMARDRGAPEIVTALMEARDPLGNTLLMLAAREGHVDNVNALIAMGADINAVNQNGDTASTLAAGQQSPQHQEVRLMLEFAGQQPFEPVLEEGPVVHLDILGCQFFRHLMRNNVVYISVNRTRMAEVARHYLHALTEYLRHYRDSNMGSFADLSLNVNYSDEAGIDAGGLSREFMGQFFAHLLEGENPFDAFALDQGVFKLSNLKGEIAPENLRICKEIGIFLAAICSGFPARRDAKIGNIFSDSFYHQLLATYKYAEENTLKPFNSMSEEERMRFAKAVAESDTENPIHKTINHNFDKATYTDNELDDILYFLVMDILDGNAAPDIKLNKLLNELIELPNCLHLLRYPKIEYTGSDGQVYDRKIQLHNCLRFVLSDKAKAAQIRQRFIANRTEIYTNVCIPLASIGEGFSLALRSKMAPIATQFEVAPTTAVTALAQEIQGPSFSRQAFMNMLERSEIRSDSDVDTLTTKLQWLKEWCSAGVQSEDGQEVLQATEQDMKDMLLCITGTNVLSAHVRLTFNTPSAGRSKFHTCFNSVNPGSATISKTDKIAFIREWMDDIRTGLAGGFSLT